MMNSRNQDYFFTKTQGISRKTQGLANSELEINAEKRLKYWPSAHFQPEDVHLPVCGGVVGGSAASNAGFGRGLLHRPIPRPGWPFRG